MAAKVTIIVESESVSTKELYDMLMASDEVGEERFKDAIAETTGTRPSDLRVYVVPGDD